ncbi:MAG TPA: FG-GAP-like repeat-containing protein [Geobacteraceae bacterium]|nr:FG-GAP-like repeat-containing protein [Geobacteraceae bacterium]
MKHAGTRILAAMFTLLAPLSALAVSFSAATTTDISPYAPTSAAIADFNSDGSQDTALVMSNGTAHYLRIMIGDALGGFSSPTDLTLPDDLGAATVAGSVVVADLNGDGSADLAVSNTGANCVSIFLGNGDGSFTKVTPDITVGTAPKAIAAGDFRGDGSRDDIAVVNSADNSVAILLNDGTGTMAVQGSTYWPSAPDAISALAVGDFNGDDIEDIAITRNSAGNVTVFKGNGVGTFAAGADITVGTAPVALLAADLNGDGLVDLAVLNGTDATISTVTGNKSGVFSVSSTFSVTNPADNTANPVDILAIDLSRDGILDLAVANNAKNNLSVLAGKGDATFSAATAFETFTTGAAPAAIASGDIDGSGNDLLSLSSTNTSYSILLNGSAATPGIKVLPVSYDFGKFQTGHLSYISTKLTVANPGTASLAISSMLVGGTNSSDFEIRPEYGTCATTLPTIAAGTSCTVELRFKSPITQGAKSASLTIASNAAASPAVTVPLTGTGVSFDTPYTVNITFIGRGSGTVAFSSGDTSCTTNCSRTPAETDTITLTPAADSGSFLYGWQGCDDIYNGGCVLNFSSTLAHDRNLTVNFGATLRRVMVSASIPTYTTTLVDAYIAAGTGESIKMPSGLLDENLTMNKAIEVTLKGGYDSGFTTQGAPTILRSITVAAGTAIMENIALQ